MSESKSKKSKAAKKSAAKKSTAKKSAVKTSATKTSAVKKCSPSKAGIIREAFRGKTRVDLDVLLKLTGWNGHVLHSAMAVLRDLTRTKSPENRLVTRYDRENRVYIKETAK